MTGELSNNPCAHFVATVERDYEVVQHDAGRKTTYHVRKTEIVQSTTLFAPFEIEDRSGRAKVLPADAIIEGIAAVDRHEVHDREAGGESVMQAALGNASADRTLGFRYKEMHLPLDVEVYVLGVVGENGCIGAPPAERQRPALPDQRQVGGDARGGARQRQQSDAGARRRLPGRCRREFGVGCVAVQGGAQPAELPAGRAARPDLVVTGQATTATKRLALPCAMNT